MLNTQKSQPQNWYTPFREMPSATLASDETLAMILHVEIQNKQKKEVAHSLFAVVRKGNIASARYIVCHGDNDGFCAGHAQEIAQYPIENEKELIEEVRNQGLMMCVMLLQEPADFPLTMDINKPAFYLKTPPNATNSEILSRFAQDTDPQGAMAKEVITQTLGLKKAAIKPNAKELTPQEDLTKKAETLKAAAIEEDLVKRFGKKKMTELAQKMNYHGQIINKANA